MPKFWLALLLFYIIFTSVSASHDNDSFYIAFLRDDHFTNETSTLEMHLNVLSSLKGSKRDASESHVYSYTKLFSAFAAKLSKDEATKLSGMDGIVSIIRNEYKKLQTTRSWDFIGLTPYAQRNIKSETSIIVGLIDSGITPQSESFNDAGFGPPPAKWKGSCGPFANFSGCNNKLIGAKYFKLDNISDPKDILSPMDVAGHGTHTSSTAAGNIVPNSNVFGLGQGSSRGAVPSARIAMYKVCWASSGCSDMDILAAFEAAINNGVDVISISLCSDYPLSYTEDSVSVGAFHAFKKGILTVASAGNRGPRHRTVANYAPWILTVGASGMDRQFRSKVVLGNGVTLSGIGVSISEQQTLYPLASGIDVANNSTSMNSARYCDEGSMDPRKVNGKIIYCEYVSRGVEVIIKNLGGIGTLIERDQRLDTAYVYMAPSTVVDPVTGESINKYINSTRTPYANIQKSQGVKISAPSAASFSSRGPNPLSQLVLKPDITAPGIDILASYTPLNSLTGIEGDTLYSKFNFMSGTSMSCPHVGGVAAYVKSFYPGWSPAAIKSAIMTTATPMSSKVDKDAEFAYGSGQVNPTQAIRPGLVYDMDYMSYIPFLCREGFNGSSIGSLVGEGRPICCSKFLSPECDDHDALNYPTMQLALKSNREQTVGVFHRTVTNVGPPQSYYIAMIESPVGVQITVTPSSLWFGKALQKRSFKVVVKASPMPENVPLLSGALTWKSWDHNVRSPIVVYKP